MTNVFILPREGRVPATGGIARVIAAQNKYLPEYGITIVQEPNHADVLAMHATAWVIPDPKQRVVAHCHGLYWHEYNWPKWAHTVNREVIDVMRASDVITAPSEWVAQILRRGMNASNVNVVNHGIDLDEWPLISNSEREHGNYILWDKTRIDPVCDPRPVNILANTMPDQRFVTTFGDQAKNVEVVGTLSYEEHKPLIRQASLYLATARETFGISTLEALASGIPIVGWNWAGQHEFIVNGETGWLSPIGDYDDLRHGIEYCLDNRERLSSNARQLVEERFQWKDVIKQYADIYQDLTLTHENHVKVSVIMPSYGLVKYIEEAIKSVVEQDYDNYELIIVDDCSTDGSYLIARGWEQGNKHIKVIRTPSNQYLAGALNYGIEHSSGEYIVPLDADNMLGLGALKTLASQLDADRFIDIVYGRVKFIKEDGNPDTNISGDGISLWPPDHFSYEHQLAHHNSIPSTSMYRRKIFDRIGGYRRRCKTAEDADFWCRATSFGAKPQKVTDAVTFIYRNRQESMSHVENDWAWHQWYQYPLQPFATQGSHLEQVQVPTYEPVTISVIIPVGPGHGDQGITDALDSLQAQTFTNWEAIVVDDTDKEIRWLPSWVQLYSTEHPTSGSAVARNIGITQARGSCFVLLDADDYLEPSCLEKMWNAWQQDTNNYVYCDWYKSVDEAVRVGEITPDSVLQGIPHPITCLYPISIRDRVKFDKSLVYGEDWDYILGILSSGHCATYVDEPLVYYRQTSGSNRNGLKLSREEIQLKLQEKWSERIMACGCGKATTNHIRLPSEQIQAMQISGDLVLVEFIKPMMAPITYTGKATGQNYRFGSDDNHRYKYVHRSDAEHLLARPHEFRVANPSDLADKQPIGV